MYSVKGIEITLKVPTIEETVAWYERVLGWTGHYDVFDAEGHCQFGSVMHGDRGLNLSRFSEETRPYDNTCPNFTVFISVDEVDEVYARVVESGWEPDSMPANTFWGSRVFSMRDLNGFNLMFVQMVEPVTLEEIRRRHQVGLGKAQRARE